MATPYFWDETLESVRPPRPAHHRGSTSSSTTSPTTRRRPPPAPPSRGEAMNKSTSDSRPVSPPRPPRHVPHPFAATGARHSGVSQSHIHDVLDDSRSYHSNHSRGSSVSRRERTMAGYTYSATSPPTVHTPTLATLTAEGEAEAAAHPYSPLSELEKPRSPLSQGSIHNSVHSSVHNSLHGSDKESSIHVFHPPKPDDLDWAPPSPTPSVLPPVKPSFLRLFTISPWKDGIGYLVPAIICSIIAGLVLPYMALMVGNAFSALSAFPLDTSTATDEQRRLLMHDVGSTSTNFAVAGVIGVVVSYLMNVLWIRYSENSTSALRRMVFEGVEEKPMEWFDLGMGLQETDANKVGAGGLMAKFTRETDEVRMATAVPMGLCIKAISSTVVCVILGFVKQPLLSVVVLSSYPVVMLIHYVNQRVQEPLYATERRGFAEASTLIERTTAAIATVKAFNAQTIERNRFVNIINTVRNTLYRQGWRWATTIAGVSFLMLVMFVAGFWYAAVLVASGKSDVGKVMTAFWACLLASTNTSDVVTQLGIITKGKMSLASLLTIIQQDKKDINHTGWGPLKRKSTDFGAITRRPARCHGSFDFAEVRFAYPSRPDVKVLRGITLFLPAGEMTFVVGGSGSGKSTIAQLLLRLYTPDSGGITFDEHDLSGITLDYCREHIAAVQQGCILFDMSVHDNVALGLVGNGLNWLGRFRRPEDVTREEVIEACQMAFIHDFIMSLPEGYDTKLGTGGSQLSGGQRQRLAIARARIRDPTVLILDEATSALDATSRIQVFEAIRKWRKNRTTIVITHDLSQIGLTDFVYVVDNGIVAEQGFRADLMKLKGVFATMAKQQALQPLAPRVTDPWQDASGVQELLAQMEASQNPNRLTRTASIASFYGVTEEQPRSPRQPKSGPPVSFQQFRNASMDHRRAYDLKTLAALTGSPVGKTSAAAMTENRPVTPAQRRLSWSSEDLKNGPYRSSSSLSNSRMSEEMRRSSSKASVKVVSVPVSAPRRRHSFGFLGRWSPKPHGTLMLMPRWYPTIPNKPVLFIGLGAGVAHGVCTPLWSFYIAKLIALVGAGNTRGVAQKVGVLVAISAAQGAAEWLKYAALFRVAAQWTAQIRDEAFTKVLAQDKAWFDESDHSPARVLQNLIKDVDDMRHLIATVLASAVVVIVMVNVSIIWSLAVGWKLTFVGIAIAPVYIGVVALTDNVTGRAEEKNKGYREALAKTFYEVSHAIPFSANSLSVANIRGIRAMALESSFNKRFVQETQSARRQATRAGWITSFGAAFAFGMPLFTQALMNYTGAVFLKDGQMTFEQMLQVYTLILFGITFSGQLLAFLPMVSKCRAAANDFERLHSLTTDTVEKRGVQRYPIRGEITFQNVSFAYPTRPDVSVLKDFNLHVYANESVAIVGPSGCGKSTVAALIQRMYEPTSGEILLGDYKLANAEVTFLRNHIGVVSQTASLFDASVAENVTYGAPNIGRMEVIRACKDANINGFILGLPDGYDTHLGENASLISGGQAQRLQIARALVRHASICILDECTSALDVDNQRILLDAISRIKETSTTIFVTHSLEAMRRCDRIVCLDDGRVAETGTYDELIAMGGVFARLMSTGEWEQ